jgi:hypothetical protein
VFITGSSVDQFWLSQVQQQYGTKTTSITQTQMLQQFKSVVSDSTGHVKLIIYDSNDPLAPMQMNMAVALAGVYQALPVGSSYLSTVQQAYGASNTVTLYDLRGQFSTKLAGYQWLWNTIGGSVSKTLLTISPSSETGWVDYSTEFKSFVFDFGTTSALTSSETTLTNTILSAYPAGTPVLGAFGLGGETSTIETLSQHQMYDIPNSGVSDISTFSGYPNAVNLKQVPSGNTVTYSSSKVYVLFAYSQGNALGYEYSGNLGTWQSVDPSTGVPYISELPEGWQTSPIMAELMPPVMHYYYGTMTRDTSFMSGASGGAGYVHPGSLPNLGSYLSLCNTLNANVGINEMFLVIGSGGGPSSRTSIYQSYVADSNPASMFVRGTSGAQVISGTPVFTVTITAPATDSPSTVSSTVSQIEQSASSSHFVFVFMDAANPGQAFVKSVMGQLPSNYVFLRPDDFTHTYDLANGLSYP